MSIPVKDLNVYMTWTKILPLLGISCPTEILPCNVTCPFCKTNRLTIYQDTTYLGQWCNCKACNYSSNILSLAEKVWELNTESTLSQLKLHLTELNQHDFTETTLRRYKDDVIEKAEKNNIFWKECSKNVISNNTLHHLRLNLGILEGITKEEWNEKLGKLVGTTDKRYIKDFFFEAHQRQTLLLNIVHKYNDFVVIPYSDFPGRITSFALYYEKDKQLYLATYISTYARSKHLSHRSRLPGIMGLEALEEELKGLENTSFVFMDALLTLRLQIKHYLLSKNLLPIVSVYPSTYPSEYLNQQSPNKKYVFWDYKITPEIIRHALNANGYISVYNLETDIVKHLKRFPVDEWLGIINEKARKVESVLEEQLYTLPLVQAEGLLTYLGWDDYHALRFADKCIPKVKDRIKRLYTNKFVNKEIEVYNKAYRITKNQVISKENGRVMCNALLSIDKVVSWRNKQYYAGQIYYKDETFSYFDSKTAIEKYPNDWLTNEITKNIGDFPKDDIRGINALVIAQRLSVSEYIEFDDFGWDSKTSSFVFPGYNIRLGGEIVNNDLDKYLKLKRPILSRPGELQLHDIDLLNEPKKDSELILCWSSFIIHSLLSVPLKYKKPTLVITGMLNYLFNDIARKLGCIPFRNLQTMRRQKFPIIISDIKKSKFNLVEISHLENCIIYGNKYQSCLLNLLVDHLRLDVTDNRIRDDVIVAGNRFITAFIAYAMKSHLNLPSSNQDTLDRTIENIKTWYKELAPNIDHFDQAFKRLMKKDRGTSCLSFMESIKQFISDGILQFGNEIYETGDSVYIPTEKYIKYLNKGLFEKITEEAIYDVLKEDLLSNVSFSRNGDRCGWLVSKEFWVKYMKLMKK